MTEYLPGGPGTGRRSGRQPPNKRTSPKPCLPLFRLASARPLRPPPCRTSVGPPYRSPLGDPAANVQIYLSIPSMPYNSLLLAPNARATFVRVSSRPSAAYRPISFYHRLHIYSSVPYVGPSYQLNATAYALPARECLSTSDISEAALRPRHQPLPHSVNIRQSNSLCWPPSMLGALASA